MDKATLKQYRDLAAEAEELEEQIVRLRAQAEGHKWPDGQPHSNYATDRTSAIVAQIADLSEILEEKRANLLVQQLSIERAIEVLDESRDRRIIRMYYILGLKWSEVADRMGYALDYIWELHGEILDKLKTPQENPGPNVLN